MQGLAAQCRHLLGMMDSASMASAASHKSMAAEFDASTDAARASPGKLQTPSRMPCSRKILAHRLRVEAEVT